MAIQFGLLLPHFGEQADNEKLLEGAKLAEELGFASVWVRDHLAFEPHSEFEKPNLTFYEAFTTLTALGAVTKRIMLGTGSAIPFRHPLHTAAIVGTMTQLFGPRVILGFGAGTYNRTFDAIGQHSTMVERAELVRSNAMIIKKALSENNVTYKDAHYAFENISIEPKGAGPVPFWYCGNTPASARRAVEYADGWMPGRTTLQTVAQRVAYMRQLCEETGRETLPTVGIIPPTSIAQTHEDAFKGLNIDGLIDWANKKGKWWVKPPSGKFETMKDIEGSLIAGSPDEVTEQTRKFESVGVQHLVFDLRQSFDRWFESIELLGREVLPRLQGSRVPGN